MATGECNCGAVAFDMEGEQTDIFVCHCSICRRFTGGNGVAVILCRKDAFRWWRGEGHRAIWDKPGASWQSNFCSVCGSALPGADSEDWMFVPAGLIAGGGKGLRVAHHIWVDSKAEWDVIGDEGKQHPGAFAG